MTGRLESTLVTVEPTSPSCRWCSRPVLDAGTARAAAAAAAVEVDVHTNIGYGPAVPPFTAGNLLDLHVPHGAGNARRPLVIWSEGGAWLRDDGKEGAAAIAPFFTQRGYAVAGVSLRASFQAPFPAQLHDIRAAIRWLRAHAADYGLDPDGFAIMGSSSGGWAAAIAATTSGVAQLPGEAAAVGVSSAVQAAVSFFPPTAFLQMNAWYLDHPEIIPRIDHDAPRSPLPPPWSPPAASPESLLVACTDAGGNLLGIQSCPARTEVANPITYAQACEVPVLLLHGDADQLVPQNQSQLLYRALAAAGNEVTFVAVSGAGHAVSDPTSFPPIIGAQSFTTFHAHRGGPEHVGNEPAPTWEGIEHFIHVSLSRRR